MTGPGAMRAAALVGLLLGLLLTVLLVVHFGAPAVGAALRTAGFAGLAIIAVVHLVAVAVTGLAWSALANHGERRWVFLWGRLMRDAGMDVLPLSPIGGYVLGGRALVLHGVGGAVAAASTVVDVTTEMVGQIAYTALGLGLLLWLRPSTTLAVPVALGIAVAVFTAIAFVAFQRRGAGFFDRVALRMARDWLSSVAAGAEAVQAEIHAIHRRPRGLWSSFLLHLFAWLWTGAESWLALRLMGATLEISAVLAIESLVYAIRSAAFVVPNAIGVQEGAYVMLGATFGLPPDFALGLSLLKRGRDLVIGVAPLLVWQIFESKRFWRRGA